MPKDLQKQFEDTIEYYVGMLVTGAPKAAIAACLREQRDPIPYLVELMGQAVAVAKFRAWFERHGPAWAQPLPESWQDIERIECGGYVERHIVLRYMISLRHRKFDYLEHPQIFAYARGVTALPDEFLKYTGLPVDEVLTEFPPKPLPGLRNDLVWRPPS